MKINKWTKENSNPIKDIIKFKEIIKQNSEVKLPQPYIAGMVSYKEVKNILKECKCSYEDRECNFGRIISNIKFNDKLCEYGYPFAILTLHNRSIMFLEQLKPS